MHVILSHNLQTAYSIYMDWICIFYYQSEWTWAFTFPFVLTYRSFLLFSMSHIFYYIHHIPKRTQNPERIFFLQFISNWFTVWLSKLYTISRTFFDCITVENISVLSRFSIKWIKISIIICCLNSGFNMLNHGENCFHYFKINLVY